MSKDPFHSNRGFIASFPGWYDMVTWLMSPLFLLSFAADVKVNIQGEKQEGVRLMFIGRVFLQGNLYISHLKSEVPWIFVTFGRYRKICLKKANDFEIMNLHVFLHLNILEKWDSVFPFLFERENWCMNFIVATNSGFLSIEYFSIRKCGVFCCWISVLILHLNFFKS